MEKANNLNLLRHTLASEAFAIGKALVIDRLAPEDQVFAQIPRTAEAPELGHHTAIANVNIAKRDRSTLLALDVDSHATTFIFYLPPLMTTAEAASYEEIGILLYQQHDSPIEYCYFQVQCFTARHYGMHKNIKNRSDNLSSSLQRAGTPDVPMHDMQAVLRLLKTIQEITSKA